MNAEESDFISCPYNPAHRVPKTRIQYHIVKCQKTQPPLEICPYNATHRFPRSEFTEHCLKCPQRPVEMFDKDNFRGGSIMMPRPMLQSEYLPETDPNHESWDD